MGPHRLGILLELGNFDPVVTVAHARLCGERPDDADLDVEPVYGHIARLAPVAASGCSGLVSVEGRTGGSSQAALG